MNTIYEYILSSPKHSHVLMHTNTLARVNTQTPPRQAQTISLQSLHACTLEMTGKMNFELELRIPAMLPPGWVVLSK